MGRKPNGIIMQYFERGTKLPDSSNRYEHTCRSCGEKFPKGRTDSLFTHLQKRCLALTQNERHQILCEVNNIPLDSNLSPAQLNENIQLNGATVDLPVGNNRNYRNLTALETLAEVARQTNSSEKQPMDGSRPQEQHQHQQQQQQPQQQQQASRLELQEQYTLDNPPVSYDQRTQREKRGINGKMQGRETIGFVFNSRQPASRSISPGLTAMAATSIAAAAAAYVPSMLDPQLLEDGTHREGSVEHRVAQEMHDANAMSEHFFESQGLPANDWHHFDGGNESMYSDPSLAHMAGSHNSPQLPSYPQLAITPTPAPALHSTPMTTTFTTEYGNGQKSSKPNHRAKFDPQRKKEVSELRNIGACIRCRMLRKPCSKGSPCDTCGSVESARLWKGPCMRVKLEKELTMFSANLHAALARRDVEGQKAKAKFSPSAFQVEASHHSETGQFVVFNTLEGHQLPVKGIDPNLNGDVPVVTVRLLDESDDLGVKLEAYIKSMAKTFYDEEPSHFINLTLQTASKVAESQTPKDSLLNNALNLWSIVHILIDHNVSWEMFVMDITTPRGAGMKITTDMPGHHEMLAQVHAVTEKKAAAIAKLVLKDLEKDLVKSPPHAKFPLFLTTILLLNCVEKASWLFKSWEQDSFQPTWPLDLPPSSFAHQGEKLASVLQNMLKMRSILPQTARGEDGVLHSANLNDPDAVEYFDNLKMSYADLVQRLIQTTFDVSDSRCFELRYTGKLLLPSTDN